KIGVDEQARLFLDHISITSLFKLIAIIRGSPILPHNGPVDRFSGFTIPYDRRLALVSNANGSNILSIRSHLRNSFSDNPHLSSPYFSRIMLNPARFGKILLKLPLSYGCYFSLVVKNNCPGAGCPLIDR